MEVREPLVAYGKSKFTEQEYLDMERNADRKHEFYQGKIFAMAGANLTVVICECIFRKTPCILTRILRFIAKTLQTSRMTTMIFLQSPG